MKSCWIPLTLILGVKNPTIFIINVLIFIKHVWEVKYAEDSNASYAPYVKVHLPLEQPSGPNLTNQIQKWEPTCFRQKCFHFVCKTFKHYLHPWEDPVVDQKNVFSDSVMMMCAENGGFGFPSRPRLEPAIYWGSTPVSRHSWCWVY